MPEILKVENVDRGVPRALSQEAVKELLSLARQTRYAYRFETLITVMLASGARIGEWLDARIQDIDWQRQKGTLRGKWHRDGRDVYLGWAAAEVLRQYVEAIYGGEALSSPSCRDLFIFSASHGARPLSCNSVEETFKRLVRKMTTITDEEREHLTPHSLRHTYATNGNQAGVDLYTLSQLLGHAHVSTTEIYLSVKDSHLQKATERMQGDLTLEWR